MRTSPFHVSWFLFGPKKLAGLRVSSHHNSIHPSLIQASVTHTRMHIHSSILLLSKVLVQPSVLSFFTVLMLSASPPPYTCPYSQLFRLSIFSVAFQPPSASHDSNPHPPPIFFFFWGSIVIQKCFPTVQLVLPTTLPSLLLLAVILVLRTYVSYGLWTLCFVFFLCRGITMVWHFVIDCTT